MNTIWATKVLGGGCTKILVVWPLKNTLYFFVRLPQETTIMKLKKAKTESCPRETQETQTTLRLRKEKITIIINTWVNR